MNRAERRRQAREQQREIKAHKRERPSSEDEWIEDLLDDEAFEAGFKVATAIHLDKFAVVLKRDFEFSEAQIEKLLEKVEEECKKDDTEQGIF